MSFGCCEKNIRNSKNYGLDFDEEHWEASRRERERSLRPTSLMPRLLFFCCWVMRAELTPTNPLHIEKIYLICLKFLVAQVINSGNFFNKDHVYIMKLYQNNKCLVSNDVDGFFSSLIWKYDLHLWAFSKNKSSFLRTGKIVQQLKNLLFL